MLKTLNVLMIISVVLFSCQAKKVEEKPEAVTNEASIPKPVPKANLKGVTLAVKRDLVCGMPISAGIVDTAQFKGKVYGFCAPECKAAFLNDPSQYLTAKN